MGATIVFGFLAARGRNFARHRMWMIRSYAIGLVVGIQVFTQGFGEPIFGNGPSHRAPSRSRVGVNLTVAECGPSASDPADARP